MNNNLCIIGIQFSEDEVEVIKGEFIKSEVIIKFQPLKNSFALDDFLNENECDLILYAFSDDKPHLERILSEQKKHYPHIPVILISNPLQTETIVELVKSGVSNILSKNQPERFVKEILIALNDKSNANSKLLKNQGLISDQNRLRFFFDYGITGNYITTIDGLLMECNRSFYNIFGYDPKELDNTNWPGIHFKEDLPKLNDAVENLVKGVSDSFQIEMRFIHKNGSLIWTEIKTVIHLDDNGRPDFLINTINNVTERKETEAALIESEENYRLLIENQGEGVGTVDLTETFTFANPAAHRMFEVPEGQLVGRSLLDFLSQDSIAALREQTLKRSKFESSSYDMEIIASSGTKRLILVTATPQTDASGKFIGTFGIFRDITENRKATQSLIESENRFRTLFEGSPDAIFLTDSKTGLIIDANKAACQLTGRSKLELLGMNQIDLHPNRILENLINDYQQIGSGNLKELFGKTIESLILYSNGTEIPIEISSSVILMKGKKVFQSVCRNISERKEAEDRLKKSEQTLANLISNLPGFVYRCKNDKDWTMEFISEGFTKITGYSTEDILEFRSITFNEIIHPDYRNYIWEQAQITQTRGIPFEEEYPIIAKNGDIKWVWERGIGIFDENDNLLWNSGFITEITDKKRTEQVQKILFSISTSALATKTTTELLEVVKNQLNSLLEITGICAAIYNQKSGEWTYPEANEPQNNLIAWHSERSLTEYLINQKNSLMLTRDDFFNLTFSGDLELIGNPPETWIGIPLYEKDQIFGVLIIENQENHLVVSQKDIEVLEFVSQMVGVFILRKKAENDLMAALIKAEESDRLKSAFLATMNHELRTPLNHILGFSELILSGANPNEIKTYAASINSGGKKLLEIFEDVFDLALAEQSSVKPRLQTFRLMDHFMENKAIFEKILQNSGKSDQIKLIYKPETRLLARYLTMDRSKVNQVLINLFRNAVKFTNHGLIEYGYHNNEKGNLTFYIKDTGIGIPREKQSLIFDLFRQVDDSPARAYGGIGIGLAISSKISKILQGELSVVSEPGIGSTFYFMVPCDIV